MLDDKLNDEDGRLAALRRYDILDSGEEEPFQRVVELAQVIFDAPMACISLIDEDRSWFKAAIGRPQGASIPRDIAFCSHTIREPEVLRVEDATADGRFAANPTVTGAPGIRSYLGVPLRTPDGYNVGSLCIADCVPRKFDDRQAQILGKLAEIVVEQMELRQIAKLDAMTGALTRRGFFSEAEKEFLRAARYDRPSSLVIVDIDHFRDLNDRYGHPAGDAVLISIANACMASMRRSDIFGRIGGGQFALLLPETDGHEAQDAAERIRGMIEGTTVETPRAAIRATVSCGIAPIPAPSEGVATWFAEADIALYEAKQFGRNRVVAGKARRPVPTAQSLEQQAHRPN